MNLRNFLATSEPLSRESAREVLQFDPSANAAEQVLLQFKQAESTPRSSSEKRAPCRRRDETGIAMNGVTIQTVLIRNEAVNRKFTCL